MIDDYFNNDAAAHDGRRPERQVMDEHGELQYFKDFQLLKTLEKKTYPSHNAFKGTARIVNIAVVYYTRSAIEFSFHGFSDGI